MKVRTELRAGQGNAVNAVNAFALISNDVAQVNMNGGTNAGGVSQSNSSTITSMASATAMGGMQTAAASTS